MISVKELLKQNVSFMLCENIQKHFQGQYDNRHLIHVKFFISTSLATLC